MRIQTWQSGAVTVVEPGGPLTADETEEFGSRFREEMARNLGRVVLDASDMAYLDSQGLELLVDLTQEMAQGGNALKICALSDTLREVMEVTGVSGHFEQFEDVRSAVRSFL